jgi:putative exporter of polyketide antibiotics
MQTKYKKLGIGIVMDVIGLIPIPFLDLAWAPISGYVMTKMYKGTSGKIAGIISFLEEILPLDIIPTFTIMWIYTYLIQKQDISETEEKNTKVIDV